MKKKIFTGIIMFLCGCSNSSDGVSNQKKPISDSAIQIDCPIHLSGSASNLEIALAFYEWKIKYNPSEDAISKAVQCVGLKD